MKHTKYFFLKKIEHFYLILSLLWAPQTWAKHPAIDACVSKAQGDLLFKQVLESSQASTLPLIWHQDPTPVTSEFFKYSEIKSTIDELKSLAKKRRQTPKISKLFAWNKTDQSIQGMVVGEIHGDSASVDHIDSALKKLDGVPKKNILFLVEGRGERGD